MSTPKFERADEKAFFVCPCFQERPVEANQREEEIADDVFEASKLRVSLSMLCLNRAVLVMVKALAKWMAYVPAKDRALVERQIHDMLDHEMAHYPSKD